MRKLRILVGTLLLALPLGAATFGTVFSPPGGVSFSDLALDESRTLLFLVNTNSNRIDIFNTRTRTYGTSIPTDLQPVSAALSRDHRFLYVTTYTSSLLDIIDLTVNQVTSRISLPSNPEGVAVGTDGRVLISAVGTTGSLMIYDPSAGATNPLSAVPVLPPASTPPVLPTPSGRIFVSYRSRLTATPDGRFIIGVNGPTATTKTVFVYESASGTVLRSRTVTNLSTTIAISPDGSKFMAGSTLFDTQTLQVLAQESTANAPFTFPAGAAANFNTQQNQGGSTFSPDGSVLYAAFNIAPVGAARANITQLLLNDPDNLLITTGIEMPENLAGKMVIDAAGANIYALSDSGIMLLPVSTIANLPIAVPQSRSVLLTNDTCQVLKLTTAGTSFDNGGKGRFTVSLAALTAANAPVIIGPGGQPFPVPGGGGAAAVPAPTVSVVNTGVTPVVTFKYNTAAATNPGTVGPTDFIVTSPEAINNPGVIHVYQNNRDSISQGNIVPVSINASTAEGLADILLDSTRQRVYVTNSGLNRVEIYDLKTKKFLSPIKVGQLPHGMALGLDGNTLYVANTGGESISIVDLTRNIQSGRVAFPALPMNAAVAIATPAAIAASGRGPQFIMSDGSFWRVNANQAIPRQLNVAVFGANARAIPGGNPAQWTMASTPGGEYVFILNGSGAGYLYDYTIDDIVVTKQVLSGALVGYLGPVTAGPQGRYYTVGGTVLNASLTPVVGSTTGLSPSGRLVAAVSAVSANQFAMFTVPVRANATAVVPDAGLVELYDPTTGQTAGNAPTLEGPATAVNGTARTSMFARTMAIDSTAGTAYVLTATGLSVVNLSPTAVNTALRPAVNAGGLVNLGDFTPGIAAGGMFSIFGRNLGSTATSGPPLPTILGGVCMTLNGVPIPIQLTSAGQINAQVPTTLAAGRYPLVIRSLDNQVASAASTLTVVKYAPAILISTDKQPAILHKDGRYVTQAYPAKRDETLTIFATGMGPVHGATVTTGAGAPADPVALTDPVLVYFGSPSFKQSQMIVKSSNLVPGLVGIAQITITVPGFHQAGKALPVTIKVGNVSSSTTGPAAPTVAVN